MNHYEKPLAGHAVRSASIFVLRMLRAPDEVRFHRFGQRRHGVDELRGLHGLDPAAHADGLVLQG